MKYRNHALSNTAGGGAAYRESAPKGIQRMTQSIMSPYRGSQGMQTPTNDRASSHRLINHDTPRGQGLALVSGMNAPRTPFNPSGRAAMDQGLIRQDARFSTSSNQATYEHKQIDQLEQESKNFLPTVSLAEKMLPERTPQARSSDTEDFGMDIDSPLFTGGRTMSDTADLERSVVIFGFNRSKFSSVQHHFSRRFGPIEDVQHGRGNWVTLQFSSKEVAEAALGKTTGRDSYGAESWARWVQLDEETIVGVCGSSAQLVQAQRGATPARPRAKSTVESRYRTEVRSRPYTLNEIAQDYGANTGALKSFASGNADSRARAPLRRQGGFCRKVMQTLFNI